MANADWNKGDDDDDDDDDDCYNCDNIESVEDWVHSNRLVDKDSYHVKNATWIPTIRTGPIKAGSCWGFEATKCKIL